MFWVATLAQPKVKVFRRQGVHSGNFLCTHSASAVLAFASGCTKALLTSQALSLSEASLCSELLWLPYSEELTWGMFSVIFI